MKEIKFRAYSKRRKEMYYSDVHNNKYTIGDFFKMVEENSDYNWEVMQFTGLLDKQGKDIYEGDILKIKPNSEDIDIVEVIFHEGGFCFKTKEGGIFEFYSSDDCMCITENREVIGNIYGGKDVQVMEKECDEECYLLRRGICETKDENKKCDNTDEYLETSEV